MSDPFAAAMEESSRLRAQRKALADQRDQDIADLRLSVLESAMARVETKAYPDNRE
ncbi:hypothetical protein [Bradyrhizobium sp. UFLA03-84]|uniref:hypothetical protein n=1 Tax=Bradyrhizobium sp. UFLA03-84 TaxID=418599 RepID=UPI0018E9D4BE|nr:hypothetical protein [Bradyrhizobium sp. UFLA03-84]